LIPEHILRQQFPRAGPAANDESVALGVAQTVRVVTAAALIMVISFAA